MAINVLPSDTLLECLRENTSALGGQGINLFRSAVNKSKSDLLEFYIRPSLLVPGQSYIYIAEDKDGKGSRPNFDPGNTIAATLAQPEDGLAVPGRWGLFTNPLGWIGIDARGPRPSDRPVNVGFCVYTIESDIASLSDQLKAIWGGGLRRVDEILQCFRDYRGYEVVYGGRRSLHFHFLFDLRHWKHELAFAGNSSYKEHWLADFPDMYLREAHQDRWAAISNAFRRETGIEADPGLRFWEQNRRLPLGLRRVEEQHPLGLPVDAYVRQYVLASSIRKQIPRRGKGWFHHSNLVGVSAVRHQQRQAKRSYFEAHPGSQSRISVQQEREFDKFLTENFPKLTLGTDLRYSHVEFGTQGPTLHLYNHQDDVTPSSIIQGDYKSVLLQGSHAFDGSTYPLSISPNQLLETLIEQASRDQTDEHPLLRRFQVEVHDCDSYRRFLATHIGDVVSAARLVLILGPEGCGKSAAIMANIDRLVRDRDDQVFISSPSYVQSAEKLRDFAAKHGNGPYVGFEYLSLTELYHRHCPKGEWISEIDALEMGCPSWLRAIHERQPQVYARMRAHRDELHALRDRGQIPVLFGVHETIRRHADVGMTRLFYARDFDDRWFGSMTPDERRAYRAQLRLQTQIEHVVFDEVSPSDLVSIHTIEDVRWAWEFEQLIEQIPSQDKVARYREFKKYRSSHPRPGNNNEWHDGKSDWTLIHEIAQAHYSDDDLVQITFPRFPFDDTEGMYRSCVGRFYYVTQRWWWSGVSRTTLLTTELVPTQIVESLARRTAGHDREDSPYQVFRFDRPGLFSDFVHVENHRDCRKQTLPRLIEAYGDAFPGSVAISDMAKDRVDGIPVLTHLSARGSNELDQRDIISFYTAPSTDLFAQLAALDTRFGTRNSIALWYVDRFNQTSGRSRGFRGHNRKEHIAVMSYQMYEWLAPYLFGWSRYAFPRRRCSLSIGDR